MTTKAAEELYKAQHNYAMEGKKIAYYNPHGVQFNDLPIIYGYNNGGSSNWLSAVLISADGKHLGNHCCSHECYMKNDLGILEGTRPDRHKNFKLHYPDGYRMEFVSYVDAKEHPGLCEAYRLNKLKGAKHD